MLEIMNPQPLSHYAREARALLPKSIFAPHAASLGWLAFHLAVIAFGMTLVVHRVGGLAGMVLWSLIIGHSFAGTAFVGHETMHGAVVRNGALRQLIGWFCFLPFTLSPRLWVAWHNKVHHGNTMKV